MANHLLGPVPPPTGSLSGPIAVAALVGATGGAAVLGRRFGEGGLPVFIDLPTLYHPLQTGLSARKVLMPSFRRTLLSVASIAALVGVLLARPAAQQLGFALLPALIGSVLWVELWTLAFLGTAGLFRLFQAPEQSETLDVEALERRARILPLFGSAAVMNNARGFLLAYRWLNRETMRLRPWGRPPFERLFGPFWQRLWRGLLRMPGSRLRRLVLCTSVAAGCNLLVWRGLVIAVVGVGLCLLVIGIECVDALTQDADTPSLSMGLPTSDGSRSLRYLLSGAVACTPFVLGIVALPVVGAVVGLVDVSVETVLSRGH